MKCLVVTAHPLAESLCRQLTEHVVNTLTAMDHEALVEDLYAEGFEPALTAAERASYYSDFYDFSNEKGSNLCLTLA